MEWKIHLPLHVTSKMPRMVLERRGEVFVASCFTVRVVGVCKSVLSQILRDQQLFVADVMPGPLTTKSTNDQLA